MTLEKILLQTRSGEDLVSFSVTVIFSPKKDYSDRIREDQTFTVFLLKFGSNQ